MNIPATADLSRAFQWVLDNDPDEGQAALGAAAKAVIGESPQTVVEHVELRSGRVHLKVEGYGRSIGLDEKASRAALYGACIPFLAEGDGLVIIADTAARAAMQAASRLGL